MRIRIGIARNGPRQRWKLREVGAETKADGEVAGPSLANRIPMRPGSLSLDHQTTTTTDKEKKHRD